MAPNGERRYGYRLLPTRDGAGLQHFTVTYVPPLARVVARLVTGASAFVTEYESLPGNLPHTYGNCVALWNGLIPNPAAAPLEVQPVPQDYERGNVGFSTGLGPRPYSLTYQLGTKPARMCALAQVPSPEQPSVLRYVAVEPKEIRPDSLTVLYRTLPGYLPHTYGNWVGVWQGLALPYTAPEPLARAEVPSDYSDGEVRLTGLDLSPDLDYTLVYFVGGKRIHAAALLYFRTTSAVEARSRMALVRGGGSTPRGDAS